MELRLLTNVIKHRDGYSANKLRGIRDDIFKSEFTDTDVLKIRLNTLLENRLNLTSEDLKIYCEE